MTQPFAVVADTNASLQEPSPGTELIPANSRGERFYPAYLWDFDDPNWAYNSGRWAMGLGPADVFKAGKTYPIPSDYEFWPTKNSNLPEGTIRGVSYVIDREDPNWYYNAFRYYYGYGPVDATQSGKVYEIPSEHRFWAMPKDVACPEGSGFQKHFGKPPSTCFGEREWNVREQREDKYWS